MILFDSHTHLMDEQYKGDVDNIIAQANSNDVFYMTNIGYNKETSEIALQQAKKHIGVYATVGLHPENALELDDDFKFIYDLIADDSQCRIVAIGEIGLDYHYLSEYETEEKKIEIKKIQKDIFLKQINIANELGYPVVIHSRDADMDMLEILKSNKIKNGFVMHCFSSSVEVLKEILKLGAYISIAGPVTFKNARTLVDVAKLVPNDKLLIETDAPYLAPEPNRGKRNEPAYVKYTAEKLAELRKCSIEDIANITTNNAKRFYNIL